MARYHTRPRSTHLPAGEDFSFVPHLEVPERTEVDTGLVDAMGRPIWRVQDPIGFGKREGWVDE